MDFRASGHGTAMHSSFVAAWLGFTLVALAGCSLFEDDEPSGSNGIPDAGEAGETATGGFGTGGTLPSGGTGGGLAGGGGTATGGRGGGAGSAGSAGAGSGGTGGEPPFPPMGGSAPPLVWKTPDVRMEPAGRYPDILPDGMGGLWVVAHAFPAYLFDYTPDGWSPMALQYAPSVGSPQLAGDSESPFIQWRTASLLEMTTFDGAAFAETTEIGTLADSFPGDMELHASAAAGTALVLYSDGTNVYVYDFDGTSWSPERIVGTGPNEGIARVARATMDDAGRAAVVWQQQDGVNGFNDREAAGALFDGTTWQPAEILGDPGSEPFQRVGFVDIDVNSAGKGFAVWGSERLWVMPVDLAAGWGEPVAIDADTQWLEDWPHIAVNEAGQAVLSWYEEEVNVFTPRLAASIYTPGSGWSAPQVLMDRVQPDTRVAIDASGRAVVAWVGDNILASGVFATHYTPSGGWGQTVRVVYSTLNLTGGEVSIQGDTVFLVWAEADTNVTFERLLATTATLPR